METSYAASVQGLSVACPGFGHARGQGDSGQSLVDLWRAFAQYLLDQLASGNGREFDAGFVAVARLLESSGPTLREAAIPFLFGDFTRRAIAAGIDRTRFVAWLGPRALLEAPQGRLRGRVLYFDDAKGRGKLLASDAGVVFVHYSAIAGSGFRSFAGGELVEFERIEAPNGHAARNVTKLTERRLRI